MDFFRMQEASLYLLYTNFHMIHNNTPICEIKKNIAVFEIQIYNEGILQLLLIMVNKSHSNMRGCK